MCGLFCCIYGKNCENNFINSNEFQICKNLIENRGPDSQNERSEVLSEHWLGHFIGSVLWMQGNSICYQPMSDDSGNILLWNGDIFYGSLESKDNDTIQVLNALQHTNNILSILNEVKGPFSFIYFQKSTNHLYFGRDKRGRHSLLIKLDQSTSNIILSSVFTKHIDNVNELPALGIFAIDLNNCNLSLIFYPWSCTKYVETIKEFESNLKINISINDTHSHDNSLINSIPNNIDTLYLKEISNTANINDIMDRLLENKQISYNVATLLFHLNKSIDIRIRKKPELCRTCIRKPSSDGTVICCNHSKVGVLFSGGLDSAIIAVIADKYVSKYETIDLINVAFEKKLGSDYEVPDRKTGKSTYSELLKMCPERKWNFVEVNVPREELKTALPHVADLIHPLDTILDESIGCALHFASRAKGTLYPENDFYESPARILLLGMGADELFGGYMRHRTILKRKGWSALMEEIDQELIRIPYRNLGRDDRVVCNSGRQARYPYLDEELVEFVQSLQVWERCYPTDLMPCGLGDKLLLRLAARKLNLNKAANFPKRALQFGSRIANSKENAKDKSLRL